MNILDEIESLADRAFTWIDQSFCSHQVYRPGLVKGNPGRICRDCIAAEEMSEDAFYAEFGEKAMAEVKRRQTSRAKI